MANYNISYGLSNVHICTDNGIHIPLPGAISIELNIDDDYEPCYIKGQEAIKFYRNNKASGNLVLAGLNDDAREVLFGITKDKRGGIKSSNNNNTHLHLLLQQELSNGSKNLTHIYDVCFKHDSLSSRTTDEDISINEVTLDFDCYYSNEYDSYFYTINSKTCNDLNAINNFFTELIYPIK